MCDEWLQNRLVNPETGRKIKQDGPTYKTWKSRCEGQNNQGNRKRPAKGPAKGCDEWLQNRLVNPDTGRKIKRDGPTYKTWKAQCEEPDKGPVKGCDEWLQNRLVNPDTGRKIKRDGPTYKTWKAQCEDHGGAQGKGPATGQPSLKSSFPWETDPVVPYKHEVWFDDTWIRKRISDASKVRDDLKALKVPQWEYCLSAQSKLADALTNIKVLGQGSFGQVYLGYLRNIPMAIKEAKLETKVQNQLVRQAKPNRDLFPEENLILDLTNSFLIQRKSPNFIFQYHVALCNQCRVETIHRTERGMCSTTFMEPAAGSLYNLRNERDVALQISLLYQLLLAVALIHQELQLIHNDIKLENILIKATPELEGTYFVYETPKGIFYVPNQGYLLILADFGVSYCLGPKSSTKEYGMRNAKVITKGDDLILHPITSQYHFIHEKKKGMVLVDSPATFSWTYYRQPIPGTVNTIYNDRTGNNIKVSEPIDITKPLEYPPQEFIYDVQDVLKTFFGGKRSTQSGNHPGFRYLDGKLDELLYPYLLPKMGVVVRGPLPITGVHFYLALEMLKKIYVPPLKMREVKISGVFNSTKGALG